MGKLLVLYVFHIYNDRVKHFIKNCIFYDENVDFVLISNDKTNVFDVPKYVKCIFRDNIGFDFGGWSDALLTDNLYEKYDKFIFVNSSVLGPFIPSHYAQKWTDIYINGLTDTIKLFGSTINTINDVVNKSHVQSYIFSMDKITLKYLIDCQIFSITNYAKTFNDAVSDKEILMSRKIIENGWNIGSLLPLYNDVDFCFKNKKPSEYNINFLNDIMYPQYRNKLWTEYQLVFIKGNRVNINTQNTYTTITRNNMSLVDLADNSRTDKNTIHSYLPLYQQLLIRKKDSAKNVLEVGIWNGGSIKLWSDFFTNATVFALDIRHSDTVWDSIKNKENIVLYTSTDAYDVNTFTTNFLNKNIKLDFMLDDGPHTLESMKQFIKLYSQVMTDDGILIIEDVQNWDWITKRKNEVPEELKQYVKVYDLRQNKGRYDDIVFTIDKLNI